MQFFDFEQFFPYYMGQHRKAATRWTHLAGTVAGVLVGGGLLVRGRWRGLPAMPVMSYGVAWASHFLIEQNRPATWGHPLWSFRGDMRMISMMLRGRDRELAELGRRYHNSNPQASLADQVVAA